MPARRAAFLLTMLGIDEHQERLLYQSPRNRRRTYRGKVEVVRFPGSRRGSEIPHMGVRQAVAQAHLGEDAIGCDAQW